MRLRMIVGLLLVVTAASPASAGRLFGDVKLGDKPAPEGALITVQAAVKPADKGKADTAPPDSHSPIQYGVAIVWTARNITAAGDFIEFLLSSGTQNELKKYGFDQAGENIGLLRRQEVKP